MRIQNQNTTAKTVLSTIKKLRIFVALLLVSGSAFSANWEAIHKQEGHTFYIDRATVTKSGSKVRAWFKEELDRAQIVEAGQNTGKQYTQIVEHTEYDCKAREKKMLSFVLYSNEGAGLYSADIKIPSARSIPPGTMGEFFLEIACSTKPKK